MAIVNRAFADTYLPKGEEFDRRLITPSLLGDPLARKVVGVVADLTPEVSTVPTPAVYVPFGQEVWSAMRLLVATSEDSETVIPIIRERIWAQAPTVTLEDVGTLREKVASSLTTPRFAAVVVGAFAVLALILASLGLYGILSFFVTARVRELAIRRAVGAREGGILLFVLRQGLVLTGTGLVLGIPLAYALNRALASRLYGVSATDGMAFALTGTVFVAVALLASLLPALRAVRFDPVTILREE